MEPERYGIRKSLHFFVWKIEEHFEYATTMSVVRRAELLSDIF